MTPHTLVISMSYLCNITCRHCSVSCGPRTEDVQPLLQQIEYQAKPNEGPIPRLSSEDMLDLIDQGCSFPTVHTVAFTGGEPMLHQKELFTAIARVKRHGRWAGMVTNGFWGKKAPLARRKIAELKNAGLDEISLSCGDFHQEHIPLHALENCTNAALEEGIRVTFSLVLRKDGQLTQESLCRELGISKHDIGKRVFLHTTNAVPSGRRATRPRRGSHARQHQTARPEAVLVAGP